MALSPSVRRSGARLGVVLLVVLAALKVAWVCDDAYISFRVVDNLLQGHGLVWNPGERVQAFTHPLWVALLALGAAATGELYFTSIALGLICLGAATWLLTGLGAGRGQWTAVLVLGASKAAAEYGTSGLENSLSALLVVGTLVLALRGRERETGLVLGLLPVCRPDLALVGLPLVVGLALRRRWGALALAGLPLALWSTGALVYYGAVLPNTALAKLGHGSLGGNLGQGLAYLWATLRWDPLAAAVVVVGLGRALQQPGSLRQLGLGGLLYLGFSTVSGGDFMVGRFHVVVVVIGVAGLVLGGRGRLWAAAALFAAVANPLGPWRTGPDFRHASWDDAGIADERGWYYDHLGLWPRLRAGRGAPQPGPQVGVGAEDRRVAVGEAVGLDGYMAGPGVHIIDVYGLCDPLLARLPSDELHGRPGHWRREPPAGYVQTLESGENNLEDERLRALWSDLAVATRGPIWAPGRRGAVWRVATTWRVGAEAEAAGDVREAAGAVEAGGGG